MLLNLCIDWSSFGFLLVVLCWFLRGLFHVPLLGEGKKTKKIKPRLFFVFTFPNPISRWRSRHKRSLLRKNEWVLTAAKPERFVFIHILIDPGRREEPPVLNTVCTNRLMLNYGPIASPFATWGRMLCWCKRPVASGNSQLQGSSELPPLCNGVSKAIHCKKKKKRQKPQGSISLGMLAMEICC